MISILREKEREGETGGLERGERGRERGRGVERGGRER